MSSIKELNSMCLNKNNSGFCKWEENDINIANQYYRSYCNKVELDFQLCKNCESILVKTFNNNSEINNLKNIVNCLVNKIEMINSRLEKLENK